MTSNTEEVAEFSLVESLPTWARASGYWARSLEPLRLHPGVWAKVTKMRANYRKGVASAINHRLVQLPPGLWRAAVRGGQVYVCFCGEAPPDGD